MLPITPKLLFISLNCDFFSHVKYQQQLQWTKSTSDKKKEEEKHNNWRTTDGFLLFFCKLDDEIFNIFHGIIWEMRQIVEMIKKYLFRMIHLLQEFIFSFFSRSWICFCFVLCHFILSYSICLFLFFLIILCLSIRFIANNNKKFTQCQGLRINQ